MGQARSHGRGVAAAAGLAVLAGAVTMLVALVAAPGSWLTGYVSEAGTAGQPLAPVYRAGLVVLAAGVGLLGRALAPVTRRTGLLLGAAALLAGTSGVVPCSEGCPLPPYEPTTVIDVVHTAASIVGMAILAGAMLSLVLTDLRHSVRRLALVATCLTVPLGLFLGFSMGFVGRTQLSALTERVLLVIAVSWLIGTAGLAAVRNSVILEPWTTTIGSRTGSRSSRSASPR